MGRHGVQGREAGPADDKLSFEPSRSGQQTTDAGIEHGIATSKRSVREGIHGICPLSVKVAGNLYGPPWNVNLAADSPGARQFSVKVSGRCGRGLLDSSDPLM